VTSVALSITVANSSNNLTAHSTTMRLSSSMLSIAVLAAGLTTASDATAPASGAIEKANAAIKDALAKGCFNALR
jgi:hypothetical protein